MTKSTVKEFTHGQMDVSTKVVFTMASNMVKASIHKQMAKKFTASGKKVRRALYAKIYRSLHSL